MNVLLEALAERVHDLRRQQGPWESLTIVVPHPFLKAYVREGLARTCGLAANLHFLYLDQLWTTLVPSDAFRILHPATLKAALLAVLGDPHLLDTPSLAPVRTYLGEDRRGLKAAQFATELTRIFHDYQLTRPDWLDAWRQDRPAPGVTNQALEAWQRALWRAAVARLDATGHSHRTLVEALRHPAFGQDCLPPVLHAFGLTHTGPAYHALYQTLGQRTECFIYALNPCGEFWEDLTVAGERCWAERRPRRSEARRGGRTDEGPEDPYALETEGPEALQLWGRAGRENIRLLNEISECDFDPRFSEPPTSHLLGRIQGDILRFSDPPTSGHGKPDDSLRFVRCPSPRREAEIVASLIWDLVASHAQDSDPLRFSDIAVLLPPIDLDVRIAHLEAAFHEAHQLPWNAAEAQYATMRACLEAARLLLELPASGFTRSALLRVLAHPILLRHVGDPPLSTWSRWCEELGILRGFDRHDWADTYVEGRDVLNWDQGLKRLTLGAYQEGSTEWSWEGETYGVPEGVDAAEASAFIALARGLLEDARTLTARPRSLPEGCRTYAAYFRRWLEGDDEANERILQRITDALEALATSCPEGMEPPHLEEPALRFLIGQALDRLQEDLPRSLGHGVVIGTYETLRGLPFRVLILTGLEEGTFPTPDQRSPLDLRNQRRRAGDVTPAERQRYLFLEALLSAQDHLVLTYVGMDPITGEPQEASSLYKDFLRLAERYLEPLERPSNGTSPLETVHPLHRFDPAYFPEWFPGSSPSLRTASEPAAAEAWARRLGQDLRQGLPYDMPAFLEDLPASEPLRTQLKALLKQPDLGRTVPPPTRPRFLRIKDLSLWLQCPLTGGAVVRLGFRGPDDEDTDRREDEALETEDLHRLAQDVAWIAARTGSDPRALFRDLYTARQRQGRAPWGPLAEQEWQTWTPRITAWMQALQNLEPLRSFHVGPITSPLREPPDEVLPALRLDLSAPAGPWSLELIGALRRRGKGTSLFLKSSSNFNWNDEHTRAHLAEAYVEHLVLTALGRGSESEGATFIVLTEKEGQGLTAQANSFSFPTPTPEAAKEQLQNWAQALFEEDPAILLPLHGALKAHQAVRTSDPNVPWRLTPEHLRSYVQEALGRAADGTGRPSIPLLRGLLPDPTRFDPPTDPMTIVKRRLAPLLALFEMIPEEPRT